MPKFEVKIQQTIQHTEVGWFIADAPDNVPHDDLAKACLAYQAEGGCGGCWESNDDEVVLEYELLGVDEEADSSEVDFEYSPAPECVGHWEFPETERGEI
jgi:hypothetical protein